MHRELLASTVRRTPADGLELTLTDAGSAAMR